MSDNHSSIPFNRDKFLRELFMQLRADALAYKAKKDSTSNDALVIGPKPLLYDLFVTE
jgi:hypothetical protein